MSDDLRAENAELRRRLESCLHTGDMEHARMASLLGATTDLLNQLALLTRDDATYLWRIGGRPLDDAYTALKRSAEAVRPQADALLSELTLLRELAADVARWRETGGDPRDLRYILDTMDKVEQHNANPPSMEK